MEASRVSGILGLLPIPAAAVDALAEFVTAPVPRSLVRAETASLIEVADNGEDLVELPQHFPQRILYDDLDLPSRPGVFVRRAVLDRLEVARASLPSAFDLVVIDAWRSSAFQQALREFYARGHDVSADYVASSADPRLRAGHTTGGAVDVTLSWRGLPLALGTHYDVFDQIAHPEYFDDFADESLSAQERASRDARRLLGAVMVSAGFAPYPFEWWHWSFGDQWWAAYMQEPHAIYDTTTT